jgi:hypothetical protein
MIELTEIYRSQVITRGLILESPVSLNGLRCATQNKL